MPTNPNPKPKPKPKPKPATKTEPAPAAAESRADSGIDSLLPDQAPPVKRPPALVKPEEFMAPGQEYIAVALKAQLLLGANFNDPPRYSVPSYDRMRVSGSAHGSGA
jgi:cyanobactin biosynthesis protein (PatB/AcyB/McaB family)